MSSEIPYAFNLLNSLLCGTLSKAFFKLVYIASMHPPVKRHQRRCKLHWISHSVIENRDGIIIVNSSPHARHGTNHRHKIPLPSIPLSPTHPVIRRSICFPPNWFHYSCVNPTLSHNHHHANHQPLRHRHLSRLQQGV